MISIIITAFREEKNLPKLLNSLIIQLPKNSEILIVAPDEPTLKAAKEFSKKDKRIKVLKDPGKGKPTALNLGIKKVKGEIVVLTDGDVIIDENAILPLIKHFKNKKVGAVCGRVVYQIPNNNLFYEWAKLSENVFHETRLKQSGKKLKHPTGYLYAVKKSLFPKIPFNALSDDAFVGMSIVKKGYKIVYEPKAIVYVKFPRTIKDFVNQKLRTRAGFLQIKIWFGENVRGLSSEIKFFPKIFKYYKWKIHKLLIVLLIYLFAWFKAYWVIRTRKSFHQIWKRIESTK